MRTPEEIKEQIKFAKDQLDDAKDKYSGLHQIDMQSADGNMLREIISQLRGKILALEWVLGMEDMQ